MIKVSRLGTLKLLVAQLNCASHTKGLSMDVKRQFPNLTWCNPVWCFPSMSKETNELLQQCVETSTPNVTADIEDTIDKSKKFPIPFPIESVRLQKLRERRPVDSLKANIASTYPIIHERVLLLITHFLIYKREFGSIIEKVLYKDMSVIDFVDRLLKKRAIVFMGAGDTYKLITGETGMDGWDSVGTYQQRIPLIIEECLSYDEMKLSAMLYVTGHTEFINNGSRNNAGIINEDNVETNGVVMGLIGPRFERPDRMEWEDILITEGQNTPDNGYGEGVAPTSCLDVLKTSYVRYDNSAKNMWRQIWSEFYQVHSYTYSELTTYVEIKHKTDEQEMYTDRYVKLHGDVIFDNEVYYKRLSISLDCAILEANERAKALNKMAFLNIVGIGLGVWRVSHHQPDVYILTTLERLRSWMKKEALQHVSDVVLSYIPATKTVLDLFTKSDCFKIKNEVSMFLESKKHPNGGIKVYLVNRNPSVKLTDEHSGKLLVTTYAWDCNAHPGNEFWFGSLTSSGDPAAACSTQVAELHNAHVNPAAVSGHNLRVAGTHGVLPVQEYCRKLLSNS